MIIAVVCGWPLSGKTTLARILADDLDIAYVDIDEHVRLPVFKLPNPHPSNKEEMKMDGLQMKWSYYLLYTAIDGYLEIGKSVIVTATFSRARYWEPVVASLAKYPEARFKVIWCRPNDSESMIEERLSQREFGVNYWSAVNSYERYKEIRDRYEPITLPHLLLDTSRSIGECRAEAIGFLHS